MVKSLETPTIRFKMVKILTPISHVKARGWRGTSWNVLYRRFGIKKVNRAIHSGKLYAGMDGKPTLLTGK